MVIRVLDHVPRCSTYEEGDVIYRLVREALGRGDHVEISFDGVLAVPSAFVNAALVRLLEDYNFSFIREKLKISNSTRQINQTIRERFDFAQGRAEDREDRKSN